MSKATPHWTFDVGCSTFNTFVVQAGRSFIRDVQGSASPPAKKTAGQIVRETLKKRITNIEQEIMNVELGYSIDLY